MPFIRIDAKHFSTRPKVVSIKTTNRTTRANLIDSLYISGLFANIKTVSYALVNQTFFDKAYIGF